jgi:hypothetical protein
VMSQNPVRSNAPRSSQPRAYLLWGASYTALAFLAKFREEPKYIETMPRRGYRLIVPVSLIAYTTTATFILQQAEVCSESIEIGSLRSSAGIVRDSVRTGFDIFSCRIGRADAFRIHCIGSLSAQVVGVFSGPRKTAQPATPCGVGGQGLEARSWGEVLRMGSAGRGTISLPRHPSAVGGSSFLRRHLNTDDHDKQPNSKQYRAKGDFHTGSGSGWSIETSAGKCTQL